MKDEHAECDDSPAHRAFHTRVEKLGSQIDRFRDDLNKRLDKHGLANCLERVVVAAYVAENLVLDPAYMPKLVAVEEIKNEDRRKLLKWTGSPDAERYCNLALQLMGDREAMSLKIMDIASFGLELYETEVANICRDLLVELEVLPKDGPPF